MRYTKTTANLFITNRAQFAGQMKENCCSAAVLHSNDLMPKNADQMLTFQQNSDLFYLSGIDQEETILLLFKTPEKIEEILFIKETSDLIKVWEGEKLSKKEASEISGVKKVFWETEFKEVFQKILNKCEYVYLNSNEHPRAKVVVETRDARFQKWIRNTFKTKTYLKTADILYGMRSVKKDEEVEQIKKACNITKRGVERVLKFLKPGVYEYQIEAEIIHEFINNRSRGFAYNPIIASGKNACILHYDTNNQQCQDGDVVLMDFGAEYGNYASDLTRCFPVNGVFTRRQKAVYNSVLNVMKKATELLRPGVMLADYEKNVGELMSEELINLGLLSIEDVKSNADAYKKYYMHGTSHHLGLDVHDVSNPAKPLCGGMVLTCEPGIYIPEEGLGIRLENDILITENGPNLDLMSDIPIEADEIEELLNI